MQSKFPNNTALNHEFEKIEFIRYFPYVGTNFLADKKRIMIFGHNSYVPPEKYDSEQIRTSSKTHNAEAMEEYTYCQEWWTKTFRKFIKGSLAINENYTLKSNVEIINKIDDFVKNIAHINYVNDKISSLKATNINVDSSLLQSSHKINKQLLEILEVTHIVCWGKHVFNYILSQPEIEVIVKPTKDFKKNAGIENRKGFEYAIIRFNGANIHILKTFHPSMPGFGHYKENTQKIMAWFYNL